MGYIGVHHLVSLDDFKTTPSPGTVLCGHCGRLVPTGICNLLQHMDECPDHPVFVTDGGFDLNKMEATGKEMKFSEWIAIRDKK